MKRWSVAIALALTAAVPAAGQEFAKAKLEKSPRHQEYVKVKHGNRELTCLVVYPEVRRRPPP
jgi:carboxymethylenebutenolidase